MRLVLLILTLFSLLLHVDARAESEESEQGIRVGVLAKRGRDRCLAQWVPTAEYLSEQIPGYHFEIQPLGFDEINPAVERGEVDFVLANPVFYVDLEQRYGASAIATLENLRLDGSYTVFGGVVFCRADRESIQQLSDLKGRSFAAVAESSLGGWLMAWRELKAEGLDPHRDFKTLRFVGTHDAVVYAVLDGDVDAGTVRTDTLERMETEGRIRLRDVRVIRTERADDGLFLPFVRSTPAYPEWPFARAKHTSNELADSVSVALLRMDPQSPAAEAALCAGWTAPLQYQEVRECLKELQLSPYEDYGKVTLVEALWQHWPWAAGLMALMVVIGTFAVQLVRLNKRIIRSEARSRLLLESVGEGIFGVAKNGLVDFINPAGARMLGFEAGELVGNTIHGLIHHTRADGTPYPIDDCPMNHSLERGTVSHCENEVLWRKDGSSFPVEYTSVPTQDGDDTIGSVVVFHDITKRKRAEGQLRKLSRAVEQSSSSVVITDLTGCIEYTNPKFSAVTGYTFEEVQGKNPRMLKSGSQSNEFYADLWATITSGREWHGEFCNRKKSGELYWEAASISPVRDASGEVTHYVGVKDDITERKKQQEAVERSERELKQIVEVSPFPIAVVTTQGDKSFCEFLNQTFVDLFGWTIEDLPDMDAWYSLAYPDPEYRQSTRDRWTKRLATARKEDSLVAPVEVQVRCKDGEERTVQWSAATIGDRFIAMAVDLTERKRANDALAAAHARMKHNLDAAARVQRTLLPSSSPGNDKVNIAWVYRPCDELAGDALNTFTIDDRHICLYLLDVSGHGVPAALLSVSAMRTLTPTSDLSSIIREQAVDSANCEILSPAEVARRLNILYPMESNGSHYFTLVYGIIDVYTGRFRFTSAGHPGPIVVRRGESAEVVDVPSFPIGMMDDAEYEDSEVQLNPGDRLYLHSDGINEEHNHESVEFGRARLMQTLTENMDATLEESVDELVQKLIAWRGDDHFTDDVSLLGLEMRGG